MKEHVSKRIIAIMEEKNLSKAGLSKKLGLNNNSTVARIVSGQVNPSWEILTKLLAVCPNIDSNWLITGEGEMHKQTSSKYSDEELEKIIENNNKLTVQLIDAKNEHIKLLQEHQNLKDEYYAMTRRMNNKKGAISERAQA